MRNLMQQVNENPQHFHNLMSAPYMQSLLQSMASNPNLAQNVIAANPLLANNPALQVIPAT